jgi:replicative DNA helicase
MGRREVLSACETVAPQHITCAKLRRIYTEIRKLHAMGKWPDMAKLAQAGCSIEAMESAVKSVSSLDTIDDHAETILASARTNIIDLACKMFQQKRDVKELKAAIEEADKLVRPKATQIDLHRELHNKHKEIIEAKQKGLPDKVISTGYQALDDAIGGFHRGFNIIGGHESIGKSSFLNGLLVNSIENGRSGLIISQDMRFGPVVERVASYIYKIPLTRWWSRDGITKDELNCLKQVSKKLVENNIIIDPHCSTIADVKHSILRHCDDVDFVALDYLQKVETPARTEEESVRQVMMGLASVEPHLRGKPMILLSQLSNDPSKEELSSGSAPIPTIAQLRKFKDIKRMAETVIIIWRKHHGVLEPEGEDEAAFVIAKARNTRAGRLIHVEWDGRLGAFYDKR